jgi:hypothetical protein
MGNLSVINVVTDYSADNSGATDTSTQINNALAAVPKSGSPNIAQGAIVYFPAGTYLINNTLVAQTPFTRCVGEGKDATVILLDAENWKGITSPADPTRSYMFDFQANAATDSMIADMRIDGAAGSLPPSATNPQLYCGVLPSVRNLIERVSIYDVWGYGLWIYGTPSEWTTLVDCDADLGTNKSTGTGGNDTIGGGGVRTKIVRFYWKPTLAKNSALDFAAPGAKTLTEVSVDIIDCNNESPLDVILEGCYQSSVRGSRFYGNTLKIQSDAHYSTHSTITNPMDILVADNLFVGQQPQQGEPYVGGSCLVTFDGGIYCPPPAKTTLNNGGRIAILGNSFIDSAGGTDPDTAGGAIRWAGDDMSNSDGGSIIAGNRIINPNANGVTAGVNVPGGCPNVSQGSELPCGISVLSSYGLTIGRNTINDNRSTQLMQYAIQLFSSSGLPSDATMGRIIVQDNLCGSASGVGNGTDGTFYVNPNPSTALPLPILLRNTNSPSGYDANASNQISGLASGTQWPLAGGYPFDAVVYVLGGQVTAVDIDATATGLTQGAFYLPAGHHITISWMPNHEPTINIFR